MYHSFLEVRLLLDLPEWIYIHLRNASSARALLSYWRSMVVSDANDLMSKNRILCNVSAGGQKDRVFLSTAEAILWESLGFSSMIDLGMYTFDSLWRYGYRMSTALELEFCSASNNSSRGYYCACIFQASFSMAFLHLHWGYPSYTYREAQSV